MADEDVWGKLQHFSRNENWGDPDKMDPDFILQLDNWRHVVGYPFVLTCPAYATAGHAENSFHYKGRAADGRFVHPDTREPLSISEHIVLALRSPFGGVGIYTYSANGPFLHVDNRIATYDRKIWVCEKAGEYVNLNAEFLKKYL